MSDELILTVNFSDGELDEDDDVTMSSANAVPPSTETMSSPHAMPMRKRPFFKCRRRRGMTRISPWIPRTIQQYNHRHGMGVLCFRNQAYCLTNGITSYVVENDPDFERKLFATRGRYGDLLP
ncbi:hypothetical protein HNY73_007642 [Argiope bruennichi]|uniref:Uncharacterized protein n=1 Tax=Argiope bruennichi TaxID=94029 RepID=A0A8T0FLP4_ARGBR|nr:hypothetical protein HNY73_007642 [Argiope bruennichi]